MIVHGRLWEDKKTYALFQKAYDSVWHDGYKLWDMGVKGRMWRVSKKMYKKPLTFNIGLLQLIFHTSVFT